MSHRCRSLGLGLFFIWSYSTLTWYDGLVVEIPVKFRLRLCIHDPLEEDFYPLLHGVTLDLGDKPGGAAVLGLDGEGAWGRALGDPVRPGLCGVHLLVDVVITHGGVVIHDDRLC